MAELLPFDVLYDKFEYPRDFVRIVELELTNLEPWWIVGGKILHDRFVGLQARYVSRKLVPFAVRQDNDDVACWDVDTGGISVVHDFASAGFEQRDRYPNFAAWFRRAVDDCLAFD